MQVFGRHARTGVAVAVATALLATGIALPGPTLAAVPKSSLTIGDCSVFTENLPKNKEIRFTLRRPNGTQKAARTVGSGDGSVEIDCFGTFAIGDTLVIKRVNGPVLRTITVPRVTIAFDRATNKASGKAPAGRSARLLTGVCDASEPLDVVACSNGEHQRNFTIPASGSWSKSGAAADYDPRGGDGASLFLFTPQGDRFTANDRANLVQVTLGSAVAQGIGTPGSTVTVSIKDGATVRGSGSARANKISGFFSLTLKKNGLFFLPEVGDEVVVMVAGKVTTSFSVPASLALDVSDAADDHLSGRCFANGAFELQVTDDDDRFGVIGTAGPSGDVDVVGVTGSAPIASGLPVELWCLTPAGDRVRLTATTP